MTIFGFGMGAIQASVFPSIALTVPSNMTTLAFAIVGATFGRERFGAILGLMRPAMFPIQILGVPFAGWVYDVYQSYDPAFQVFLGLYLFAAITIAFYRAPEKMAAA